MVAAWLLAIPLMAQQGTYWAENDYLDHMDQLRVWLGLLWEHGFTAVNTRYWEPYWDVSHEMNPHPPGFKWAGMLARAVLPDLPFPLAERLPTTLLHAFCVAGAFLVVARQAGLPAGLLTAVLLGTMPRFLGHVFAVTADVWVAAAGFGGGLAWAAWLAGKGRRWFVVAAVAFAVALSSKTAAVVMLGTWGCLAAVERWRGPPRTWWPPLLGLGLVALGGVTLLCVTFPWLWPDPPGLLVRMVEQTARWTRTYRFSALYMGTVDDHTNIPWHWPFVTLFMTTPPPILMGAAFSLSRDALRSHLWRAVAVNIAFWLVLGATPLLPRYDNERQLLPVMPWLVVAAGLGWARVGRLLAARVTSWKVPVALLMSGVVGGASVLALVAELPHPLGYYSPLVGGKAGAVQLGFESTYYLEILDAPTLRAIEDVLPPGATVNFIPGLDVARFNQRRGFLRADLKLEAEAQFVVLVARHAIHSEGVKRLRARGTPLLLLASDDVMMVDVWYDPVPQRVLNAQPGPEG